MRVHVACGNFPNTAAMDSAVKFWKETLGIDTHFVRVSDFFLCYEFKVAPEKLFRHKVEEYLIRFPNTRLLIDEERVMAIIRISGFTKSTVLDPAIISSLEENADTPPLAYSSLITKNGSRMVNLVYPVFKEAATFMHQCSSITVQGHSLDFRPEWESLTHCPNLFQIYGLPKVRIIDLDALMTDLLIIPHESLCKLTNKKDALEFIITEIPKSGRDSHFANIGAMYPSAIIIPITPEFNIAERKPLPTENISTYEYALQEHSKKMAKVIAVAAETAKLKSKEITDTTLLAINVGQQVDSLQKIVSKLINQGKDLSKKLEQQSEIIVQMTERIAQLTEKDAEGKPPASPPAKKRKTQ